MLSGNPGGSEDTENEGDGGATNEGDGGAANQSEHLESRCQGCEACLLLNPLEEW